MNYTPRLYDTTRNTGSKNLESIIASTPSTPAHNRVLYLQCVPQPLEMTMIKHETGNIGQHKLLWPERNDQIKENAAKLISSTRQRRGGMNHTGPT